MQLDEHVAQGSATKKESKLHKVCKRFLPYIHALYIQVMLDNMTTVFYTTVYYITNREKQGPFLFAWK